MGYEAIRADELEGGVGFLMLHRPEKRNAISIAMRQEILACLSAWREHEGIRAVIVTGAGAAFSAGFDLKELQEPENFDALLDSSSAYHRAVWSFPKPTIAAVNGVALGGGFDLAALCDIRICAGDAAFGHPEIKLGAPPLFTPLRWIVGDGAARELCLSGRRIDAQEALRLRLVSEVVPPGALVERAKMLAATILEAPAPAVQFTKRFFVENTGLGFEESFAIEHDAAFREILLRR
jgi:enoyl-CoA hydratase